MLRFEVYVNNRLAATFILWKDASHFAECSRVATVIDFDEGIAYYFENDRITTEAITYTEN